MKNRDEISTDSRGLTEMQAAFVAAIVGEPGCIGNASAAARHAGYSPRTARVTGQQLLAKPHVQAAIREANLQQINGPLASKAVAVLQQIVEDKTASTKCRLDAAKTLLDRAGVSAANAVERADPAAKVREAWRGMSVERLEAFLKAEEAREAAEARKVAEAERAGVAAKAQQAAEADGAREAAAPTQH